MMRRATRCTLKPEGLLAVIVAAAAVLRLALGYADGGFIGTDSGAYAMHWHAVNGVPYPVYDAPVRPPLSPGWQLAPFIWAFGLLDGINAWNAIMPAIVAPAVYVLYRHLMGRRMAAWCAAVAAFDPYLLLHLSGGMEPYLGLAPLALLMAGIYRLRDVRLGWTANALTSALIVGGMLLTAASALAVTGIAALFVIPAWCALVLPREAYRAAAANLVVGALACAPLAPFYLASAANASIVLEDLPFMWWRMNGFDYFATAIGAAITFGARAAPRPIFALALIGTAGIVIASVGFANEAYINIAFRSYVFVGVALIPACAWLIRRHAPARVPRAAIGAAVVALLAGVTAYEYGPMMAYSWHADRDRIAAMEDVLALDPDLAVAPARGFAHTLVGMSGNELSVAWPVNYAADRTGHEIAACMYGWTACRPLQAAARHGVVAVIVFEDEPIRVHYRHLIRTMGLENDLWAYPKPHLVEHARHGAAVVYAVR